MTKAEMIKIKKLGSFGAVKEVAGGDGKGEADGAVAGLGEGLNDAVGAGQDGAGRDAVDGACSAGPGDDDVGALFRAGEFEGRIRADATPIAHEIPIGRNVASAAGGIEFGIGPRN